MVIISDETPSDTYLDVQKHWPADSGLVPAIGTVVSSPKKMKSLDSPLQPEFESLCRTERFLIKILDRVKWLNLPAD